MTDALATRTSARQEDAPKTRKPAKRPSKKAEGCPPGWKPVPSTRLMKREEFLNFFEEHRDAFRRPELSPTGYGDDCFVLAHLDEGRVQGLLVFEDVQEFERATSGSRAFRSANVVALDVDARLSDAEAGRVALKLLSAVHKNRRRVCVNVPGEHWIPIFRRANILEREVVLKGALGGPHGLRLLATAVNPTQPCPWGPPRA